MAISKAKARELADMLPEGIDCADARRRILCVAEVLHAITDEEHPLSNADLRAVLEARFGAGAAPTENTLNGDIQALRGCGVLGYEVHTGSRGSWCENAAFAPASVRLCLNAVQSFRFLTSEQSADVQEALGSLVSRWREDNLAYDVHVMQRERAGAEVLARCDAIAQALRDGRKVEFEYAFNGFDGKQSALPAIDPETGEEGGTLRVETPIALIFSQGNYFLESYADPIWRREHITRSRVDRMTMLRISDEPALRNREIRNRKHAIPRLLNEEFDMLGGKRRTVFLRVPGFMTNEMFDRFGFGLRYAESEGNPGEDSSTAVTCVRVAESNTFFRWLAGTGGAVKLAPPPESATAPRGPWGPLCKDVGLSDMKADYEAMVAAYRSFLEAAADSIVT